MLSKFKACGFFGAIFSSTLMQATVADAVSQLIINLPHIEIPAPLLMLFGFFYFAFLGILNGTRVLDFLWHIVLFTGCSIIQAYTLHRLLKLPCTKAVPRMLGINCITSLILFLRHLKLVDNFFTPNYQNSESVFLLWSFFVAMVLFTLQVLMAYMIYLRIDPSVVHKRALIKALILATFLSTIFLMIVNVIQNWQSFIRILNAI